MGSCSSSDRSTSHDLTWRRAQNYDSNTADISVDFLLQLRLISHSFQDYFLQFNDDLCL